MFWYHVAADFQQFLVGFIGFGGIAFSLWYNARAARRQVEDDRQHGSRTLCLGILAELEHLSKVIGEMSRQELLPNPESTSTYLETWSAKFFDGNIEHLGKVPQECVADVMNAYLSIDRAKEGMLLNARDISNPKLPEMPQAMARLVQKDIAIALPDIERAIGCLRKSLRLPAPEATSLQGASAPQ